MPEDQSVVGRRRIYYDQNGSEALICSDSEEETPDDDDDKHEFSKGEDYILWYNILMNLKDLFLFELMNSFHTACCTSMSINIL